MIVCRKCSRRVPDGTEFCVCGAYLEFDGEHVPDATPAGAAPAGASPVPPGPTAVTASGPLPPPPATRPDPWTSEPAPRGRAVPSEPAPWSGFDATTAEPAAPAGGIDAVLPDAPDRAGPAGPVWVEAGARDGDIVCRHCGTPNGPERFFCRHCGVSLTGAVDPSTTPAPRRAPWWTRMLGGAKRRATATDPTAALQRAQGLARGGLSSRTLLFRTGGVVVLLGGALAFLGPWRGPVLRQARELIGADRHSPVDVDAEEITAQPADPSVAPVVFELQGPENVIDRFANTAWATRWLDPSGPGFETVPDDTECQPVPMTDSVLVVEFAEPRDIGRLEILAGRPAVDETRSQYLRPRVLEVRPDDGPCTYVQLADTGELTPVPFAHDDVSTLTISIVGVYEPDAPTETVEISELVIEK